MSKLNAAISELRLACGMHKNEYYDHWVTDLNVPMHVERIVNECEYAFRVSRAKGGAYDALVQSALDLLMGTIAEEGVVTKKAAEEAEGLLLPMREAARKYTVHMVSHAHIDMNWMWPFHETVAVTLETFRTVLKLMEEYPEFTYAQSQASTYRIVEQYEPEMLEEIKKRIHEGRWEISASTWVEADKNMPSEESMARHLLYTKRYLSGLFDVPEESMQLDYEPDTFGHSANVPEILTRGGVKYYYHCRGYQDAQNPIYRWRAQSGKEVLVYCEPTWYLGTMNPGYAMYVPEFCEKWGLTDSIKVYGVGDHGGGPTRLDLNYILEMQKWPIWPNVVFSSYRAFYEALDAKRENFPVVQRELNCVFTGCYTTQCRVKASNKIGESMLTEAETLSAFAQQLTGRKARTAAFEENWRKLLFSQFHDILTGSGVRDTREYALADFQNIMAASGTEYAAAMRALSSAIDTSAIPEKGDGRFTRSEGAGVGFASMRFVPPVAERCLALTRIFHLFNATAQDCNRPTVLTVWDYTGDVRRLTARTADGKPLAFQLLSEAQKDSFGHLFMNVLVDVPVKAFSYETIILEQGDELSDALVLPADPRVHTADRFVLENEYLRAEFDTESAALKSLFDKKEDRELLGGKAGFFSIREDPCKGMSSWAVGRYFTRKLIDEHTNIVYSANGALRQAVKITAPFGEGGSLLTCEVSLDKGAKALRYDCTVDWKEVGTHDTVIPQLAFAAPVKYAFNESLYDIPEGLICREAQELDVPSQSFVSPVPAFGGSALVLGADSKYGFRTTKEYCQVTLIRASFDPDPYPERGMHQFSLYLGAANGRREIAALSRGMARDVRYVTARPHAGKLPMSGSFAKVEGGFARLNGFKPAEDGNGMIARLVSFEDGATELKLTVPGMKSAALCDLLEHDTAALPVKDGACVVPADAFALVSVRIGF